MKTRIATVFLMLGLFLVSSAFAAEAPLASKKARKEVTKIIKKEVKYPEFAIEEKFQCCVVISVVIQEDGTMEVDCANCVDQRMKDYVVSTLEDLHSEKLKEYAGQNVQVRIKFSLLSI
ncbi:MAG: hypothetical protein DRI89_12345 [Bacteroidetes bacterium]|nr:MAG: hypothetical protein DRI89_12345 [Bacteroidota bacterium]